MGLTKSSFKGDASTLAVDLKKSPNDITVALCGAPNVGKSTVFNSLTGLHQHTGNWAGKTVATAVGHYIYSKQRIVLIDIPGTYSLNPHSAEEQVAYDFLIGGGADLNVAVCDATRLESGLQLLLRLREKFPKTILAINFMDEAQSKGITIDINKLRALLKVPIVEISAKKNIGLDDLSDEIIKMSDLNLSPPAGKSNSAEEINNTARDIFKQCVKISGDIRARDKKIDKILTGKFTAFPLMLLLLALAFWITISAANYPSEFLSAMLFALEKPFYDLLIKIGLPEVLCNLTAFGVYRITAWIVSVMLPPMAIFFPLFSLLEDSGYLPRIAFNLDRCFKKCGACGKQSLTMCMGFGCNAAGIIGCRIIDSKRERLIAILTNSLVPCNGRFPLLIGIISMFFVIGSAQGSAAISAVILTFFIALSICITLLASFFLSKTLLKGMPSAFILELPPYRKPQFFKTILTSLWDRALFVLGRAIIAAVPAGLIIWVAANIFIGNESLLSISANFLDPFAKLLGLDGVILLAFILGLPANEIVLPLIFLAYTGGTVLTDLGALDSVKTLFLNNGWTFLTALNVMLFSLFHWPCATSLLTIKKETGSVKWALLAFIFPTIIGTIICMATTFIYNLII